MKKTTVIPALLLLTALATAQTTFAQTKDPIGSALRDILPGRQKNTVASKLCPQTNSTTNPAPTR